MWEGRKLSKWLVSHAEPLRYSGETAGLGMRGGQREAQPSVRPAGITSFFSLTLVSLSH